MSTTFDPRGVLTEATRRFLDDLPGTTAPWLHGEPADGTVEVLDPGTGERIAELPATSPAGVDRAVRTARAAFADGRWSEVDAEVREGVLLRLADLVERDAPMLAQVEALDTGKPLAEAEMDIAEAAMVIRYFAGWCTKVAGRTIAGAPRHLAASTHVEPVGVCGAITPWNYPLPILLYKLAPALAFGNTFVAKPSELAPLSAIHLAALCRQAGVPDGVVGLVVGGPAVGAALSAHPDLDKIAFTGSTRTGREVMRAAAANLTRVSLELGGKSPHIVFASADLDRAVPAVLAGIWTNAGQVCVAGSRLLVERSVADEVLGRIAEETARLQVGHGLAPGTDVGPLISAAQREHAAGIVRSAVDDGARAVVGGRPLDGPGFFMTPTVLSDVPVGSEARSAEIFAPVLVVERFDTEQEALALADATEHGLAAGVWTGSGAQAQRVSRGLRAGTVWVNTYGVFHPTLPFGGRKASGFGRELGEAGVEQYTERKTVVEDVS